MQGLILLMLFIGLLTGMDFRSRGALDQDLTRADAIAFQLATYHTAALKTCQAAACPAGAVNPSGFLAAMAAGQSIYASGQYAAASDGTALVVTTYVPRTAADRRLYGLIADSMRRRLAGQINAGPWNATIQGIAVAPNLGASAAGAPTGPVVVAVPSSVGGLTLQDGAPVLATRLH